MSLISFDGAEALIQQHISWPACSEQTRLQTHYLMCKTKVRKWKIFICFSQWMNFNADVTQYNNRLAQIHFDWIEFLCDFSMKWIYFNGLMMTVIIALRRGKKFPKINYWVIIKMKNNNNKLQKKFICKPNQTVAGIFASTSSLLRSIHFSFYVFRNRFNKWKKKSNRAAAHRQWLYTVAHTE